MADIRVPELSFGMGNSFHRRADIVYITSEKQGKCF